MRLPEIVSKVTRPTANRIAAMIAGPIYMTKFKRPARMPHRAGDGTPASHKAQVTATASAMLIAVIDRR